MRSFSYKLDDVLSMGYYEAHRLCMVSLEMRSRDFELDLISSDYGQATEDYRRDVWDWVKKSQPRKYPDSTIPQHVIDDLKRRMDEARGVKHG